MLDGEESYLVAEISLMPELSLLQSMDKKSVFELEEPELDFECEHPRKDGFGLSNDIGMKCNGHLMKGVKNCFHS